MFFATLIHGGGDEEGRKEGRINSGRNRETYRPLAQRASSL